MKFYRISVKGGFWNGNHVIVCHSIKIRQSNETKSLINKKIAMTTIGGKKIISR